MLDPECMEVAEQNGFLDVVYDGGHMTSLIAVLQQATTQLVDEDLLEPAGHWQSPPRARASIAVLTARIEAVLEILLSCVGRHGYRSQRTLQSDGIWVALRSLLCRAGRSLRCSVVRFVRQLLREQPQCATCVISHQLLPPMLEVLLEHGGTRDNLCNSAILQLLCEVADEEALAFLRVHLLRRHRPQLRTLAAAHVAPARRLLVCEDDVRDDEENQPPTPTSSKASPVASPKTGGVRPIGSLAMPASPERRDSLNLRDSPLGPSPLGASPSGLGSSPVASAGSAWPLRT